ncbi:MAG: hypothetical protein SVV80_10070 [Planctomycetota bacterium]|nr:hypothetical protein [Planctomycetota bacterium]
MIFKHPVQMGGNHIWLVIPLCMVLAVVYKTIRVHSLRQLFMQILSLWAYIFVGLAVLAVAFWILVEYAASA